jgi:PAS domain S-box-containing protein
MSYSMAFSDDSDEERAAESWQFTVMSDPQLQEQLRKSQGQCLYEQVDNPPVVVKANNVDDAPLPTTLTDALRPSQRAIVITECQAPFKIWNVNPAWENLCGYTFLESKDKTLGSLLRGSETDTIAATNLVSKLLQGESEVGTTLVNYHKNGRRFQNRVRVGPLYNQANEMTHFVGVLQEVEDWRGRQLM